MYSGSESRFRFDPAFVPFTTEYTDSDLSNLIEKGFNSHEPYYISGVYSQLKPRSWLDMLTSGSGVDPDIHYVLDGIIHGFRVVDSSAVIHDYCCKNYSSCFAGGNYDKLNGLIASECSAGMLRMVEHRPTCVHALGVINKKGSNKIRPITDCSRPSDSINDHMETVQK